jgi:hypothetical protein
MSYFSKRALRWAAPVALVGALGLAACGDNDDTEAVRVAAPSVAGLGSDQHLANQAEDLARASASAGSDQHLSNAVEEAAREARSNAAATARLQGQAETYAGRYGPQGGQASASNTAAAELAEEQAAAQAGAAPNVDAGYRAAQQAQADQYVEQQQDRAEGNSDSENAPLLPHSENSRP